MIRRLLLALAVAACVLVPGAARADFPLCSWYTKTDADTLNVAFPDESATYWGTQFHAVPGVRLVIHGTYPDARYFSFHAYDLATRTVASLADYQIDPDPGSENPFRGVPSDGAARRYTVAVEFTPRPTNAAPNTLYVGATADGLPNADGELLYRVYVPDDAANPSGGPLPEITVSGPAGDLPMGRCEPLPPSTGGQLNGIEKQTSFPDQVPRVVPLGNTYTNPPSTNRFFGLDRVAWDRVPANPVTDMVPRFKGTFFSNDQNAYLTTRISRQYGDLVAYKAKAPTFPDTRAGAAVSTPAQLRYWSLCQYELVTERFVECSADYQTTVGADGWFRFVIADPADVPSANMDGINVLAWGGPYYDGFIGYRHMIPGAGFTQAVQDVPEHANGPAIMGDHWPRVAYCSPAKIEATGFDSCFS